MYQYFYHSNKEKKGILALTLLIIAVAIIQTWYHKTYASLAEWPPHMLDFMNTLPQSPYEMPQKLPLTAGAFYFNPNTADSMTLLRLGFSPKNVQTLSNFRRKGGAFRKADDLKKIYGLPATLVSALLPFVKLDDEADETPSHHSDDEAWASEAPIKLQPFDPNTAPESVLKELGLSSKTVNGRFFKKEDIKKIYNFSDLDYLRLEPYIQISDNEQFIKNTKNLSSTTGFGKSVNTTSIPQIDANKASLEEWLQLKGIGRTFAARIIENREKLGGFSSVHQVRETYGLPDSTFQAIVPYLTLSEVTRKLYINRAPIEELTHPYWNRKQITAILRYRVNHGSFRSLSDLQKVGVLDGTTLERLAPYLSFDN